MQQISFYLKKFENLKPRDSDLKKIIIEVIKKIADVDLLEEDIFVFQNRVKINKSGPQKTEIFINREKIQKIIDEKISTNVKFKKQIF